jgi:hypothetical protein
MLGTFPPKQERAQTTTVVSGLVGMRNSLLREEEVCGIEHKKKKYVVIER